MRLILIAAAAAAALLVATGPSHAVPKNSAGESGIDACLMGNNDNACDDILCYCCTAEGCWICGFDEDGNAYQDCVWDGKYSSALHPPTRGLKWRGQVLQGIQGGGTLQMTPQPDPLPKTKLKLAPFQKPGTLAPAQ
jgi:hypothetical protein